MKVAVVGCLHGDLDKVYHEVEAHNKGNENQVRLVIICGDFQAVRNDADMQCMSVPLKYREMKDFHKYYSGAQCAPVPTLFIGGNHEAINHMQELYYGGWVAENIFFLGYSGVINFAGIRIAGLSGIYNYHNYRRSYYETLPLNERSIKSAYHIRQYEIEKLKLVRSLVDVFITHDWPTHAAKCGNVQYLLRTKRHFAEDVHKNQLGNPHTNQLLNVLGPQFWFAAHLHVRYSATLSGNFGDTAFLALDKIIPKRKYIEYIDIFTSSDDFNISFDNEWLAILRANAANIPIGAVNSSQQAQNYTDADLDFINKRLIYLHENKLMDTHSNDGSYFVWPRNRESILMQRNIVPNIICAENVHDDTVQHVSPLLISSNAHIISPSQNDVTKDGKLIVKFI